MKIAVIGAGIVGICTAYELALDGHTVSVFERHAAVAEEASFACAGHLSASLAHALSFPAWPLASRLRSLLQSSGITLGRSTTLAELRWLLGWKAAASGFPERFGAAQKLVAYSLARQQSLAHEAGLAFEQSQGPLLLLRSESELQAYQPTLSALTALGVVSKLLSPQEARKLEPALGADVPLHAALCFVNDAVGNCRQFAHALKDRALDLGVAFHFGTSVAALSHTPALTLHTQAPGQAPQAHGFEQVVVCAGGGAAALLGHDFKAAQLTRVWSYSLSAQVREPLNAPRSAVLDAHSRLSVSRMGTRIRVAGGAELGGTQHSRDEALTRPLYLALQTLFPGAADFSRSMQLWKGASVFSPDALPLLGAAGRPGLWLNLAHGHNGWSMACGAARVLADQMGARQTAVDATLVHPGRFKS